MFFNKKKANEITGRLNYDLIRKMIDEADRNPNLEIKIITACREEIIIKTKKQDKWRKRLDEANGKYDS